MDERTLMSKKFWVDAGVRAIRTMAQTALASMTVGATVSEVNWGRILSASVVAGVYSVLMSVNNLSANGNGAQAIPVTGTAEPLPAPTDEPASQNDGKAGKL